MRNFINSSEPYRTILAPFDDDDDWEDPAAPDPPDNVLWNTTDNPQMLGQPPGNVAKVHPNLTILLTFAFFDDVGNQIVGGKLDLYTFAAYNKGMFDESPPALSRKTVVMKMKSRGGSVEPLLTGFVRGVPMGVRLSGFAPPAGATKLQINMAGVYGDQFLLV